MSSRLAVIVGTNRTLPLLMSSHATTCPSTAKAMRYIHDFGPIPARWRPPVNCAMIAEVTAAEAVAQANG
ncbi:hypothetical protein SAMN04489751_1163 [Brevibacterium sandarakinum]|uniref:Uncharacterized protein n=2 Tax=Brevibacterium TaxID=1696 RepID=A0A1H1P8H6_BRESA|nr:hypothetical protein SAMN04489751_1163 [Brevibacterium sandarakinum]